MNKVVKDHQTSGSEFVNVSARDVENSPMKRLSESNDTSGLQHSVIPKAHMHLNSSIDKKTM